MPVALGIAQQHNSSTSIEDISFQGGGSIGVQASGASGAPSVAATMDIYFAFTVKPPQGASLQALLRFRVAVMQVPGKGVRARGDWQCVELVSEDVEDPSADLLAKRHSSLLCYLFLPSFC